MTIDESTLKSLRVDDVVRLRHKDWLEGTYVQGPVFKAGVGFQCGSIPLNPHWSDWIVEFEIVERAPHGFYVNADRREPAVGDVATTIYHHDLPGVGPWFYTQQGWVSQLGRPIGNPQSGMPRGECVLLFNGFTRKPMPEWTP